VTIQTTNGETTMNTPTFYEERYDKEQHARAPKEVYLFARFLLDEGITMDQFIDLPFEQQRKLLEGDGSLNPLGFACALEYLALDGWYCEEDDPKADQRREALEHAITQLSAGVLRGDLVQVYSIPARELRRLT
jgi:hypothetical protein